MSSMREHTVQSVVTSSVLYPFIGENAVAFGLSVVFIDIDHVFDYILQTRSLKVFGVFPYCKILLNAMKKNRFLVLNIFHTVEFFLLIAILGFFNPVFFYMLAGMLCHIALDIYHLSRSNIVFFRAFSIIEFFIRARSNTCITSFAKLLQQDDVDFSGVKHFSSWLTHWKNTNVQLKGVSDHMAH